MKVEFDFDGEGLPHMGVGVILSVDDEGSERISLVNFGNPDILRATGMLRGAYLEAEDQLRDMFGLIPYEDEED